MQACNLLATPPPPPVHAQALDGQRTNKYTVLGAT
jgi:hypothetical protein